MPITEGQFWAYLFNIVFKLLFIKEVVLDKDQ
jgi:hypothetical protein